MKTTRRVEVTGPAPGAARRRPVYLVGLVLAVLSVLASWLTAPGTEPGMRWGYPLLAVVLLTVGLAVLVRTAHVPLVEKLTLVGLAVLWLGRLEAEVLAHPDPQAAWASLTPWSFVGVVLLAVFGYLVLPTRHALALSVTVAAAAAVLMAMTFVPVAAVTGDWSLVLALLRYESYLVATLAMVYLLARTKDEAVGAGREAERMRAMAYRDSLTGLPNRRALSELLDREVDPRRRTPLSLVVFDLDEFKSVNDTYGHHAGDLVLQETASRLRGQVRGTDTLGRWGGEEFVVVCPGTAREEAVELAQRLRRVLAAEAVLHGVKVTASFGVAQYASGMSVETLLARADRLMYEAKASGRDRVVSVPRVPRTRPGADAPGEPESPGGPVLERRASAVTLVDLTQADLTRAEPSGSSVEGLDQGP